MSNDAITVLIVDDERLARERLRGLLQEMHTQIPLQIIGEASDGNGALLLCQEHKADLLFLDISMPQLDGLCVAQLLSDRQTPPAIIFTTAYRDYAFEAFELEAFDYLLKPIRRERLQQALEKVQHRLHALRPPVITSDTFPIHNATTPILSIKNNDQTLHTQLSFDNILFFRAEHKYTTVTTPHSSHIIETSLSELERKYHADMIRIHRNCLVVTKHIQELKHTQTGWYIRIKHHPEWLEVSRRQVHRVKSVFKKGERI